LGPEKNITAALACPQDIVKPMQNLVWVTAKGDCQLRFKPEGAGGSGPVTLTVMAAGLESSMITNPPAEDQIAKADQNPVKVTITLEAGLPSGPDAGLSAASGQGLMGQLPPVLLIFLITLVVAAMVVLLLLKYHPFANGKSGKSEFDEEEPRPSPRSPRTLIPVMGKAPIQDVLRQQKVLPDDQPLLERSVEWTLGEHSKLLLDLSAKDRDLELRIHEIADQCISMSNQSTLQAAEWRSEVRNEANRCTHVLEGRIAAVQGELAEHLARQSTRLLDLFKDLPALAELSTTAGAIDKSELAKLEDNLVSAARESALPSDRLEALQDESCSLLDAIQEFRRVAQSANRDHATKRFGRIIESATVVNNELFNLGQLAATQKHGFFVEMSLLEQSHLADDLAAALTRETMKLGDPEGYYSKRLGALRAHACVAGIDLADLDVDAERRNSGLQQALAKLLQTLGMTPIDPLPNDKLQAAEHQVVQFVRRIPGVQPGAIAHTMARGLQCGGEVIRKASVLLYE
jgi:hypothetical protein